MPITVGMRITADDVDARRKLDTLGKRIRNSSNEWRNSFERSFAKGGMGISGLQAALAGTGAMAGAKKILDWKDSLGKMQAEAQLSSDEIAKIEDEILGLSTASGKTKDEIKAALDVFQDFGGILAIGRASMGDILTVSKATGSSLTDLATIASTLNTTLGIAPEEFLEAFGRMKAMGKVGRLTLAQIAPDLPQLLGLGKGLGFTGMRGVQQLGAAQQVTAELLPSSAESRTAVQGMFRNLIARSKKLGTMGVKVFDAKGGMRDIDALMLDIMRKTKGTIQGKKGLSGIFNDEGLKAATAFLSNYDKATQNWKAGGALAEIFAAGAQGGAGATIKVDAARFTAGIAAQSEQVKRTLAEFEKALTVQGSKAIAWFADDLYRGAGVIVGALGAIKIAQAAMAAGSGKWAGAFGGVTAALSAGYAIGTIFDEITNSSGRFADWLFELTNPEEAKRRREARGKAFLEGEKARDKEKWDAGIKAEEAQKKAEGIALVKTVALSQGGQVGPGFSRKMQAAGASAGLSRSEVDALLPELQRIAKAVESSPTVKVTTAGGIDKAKAEIDRGPSWLRKR